MSSQSSLSTPSQRDNLRFLMFANRRRSCPILLLIRFIDLELQRLLLVRLALHAQHRKLQLITSLLQLNGERLSRIK